MDYTCEKGAKRNFEVWRSNNPDENKLETEDERLDRLEAEEAERGGAMAELETKVVDAKREMEIADALDEIRTRNARIQRAEGREGEGEALEAAEKVRREMEIEKLRIEKEDEEAARRAFARGIEIEGDGDVVEDVEVIVAAAGGLRVKEDVEQGSSFGSRGEAKKGVTVGEMPPPDFKRVVKKKKDHSGALGIKKKPALV